MIGIERLGRAASVVFALAAAAGCGGSSSSGPPSFGKKTVIVANNEYQPDTARITVGDTVVWAWATGSIGHNIISTGGTTFPSYGTPVMPGSGTVGTDIFNAPASYQYVFGAAGTYGYYCSTHGSPTTGMHGAIVVSP